LRVRDRQTVPYSPVRDETLVPSSGLWTFGMGTPNDNERISCETLNCLKGKRGWKHYVILIIILLVLVDFSTKSNYSKKCNFQIFMELSVHQKRFFPA